MSKLASPSVRYVAVADVLGFTSMLETIPLPDLVHRYVRLLEDARLHLRMLSNPLFPADTDSGNLVHSAIISDTVFLWSEPLQADDCAGDLLYVSTFFDVCTSLIVVGIRERMPIRVGVAYGEVCIAPSDSLFVGRPIADAFSLEQEQKWIGGACHPSCDGSPHAKRIACPWFDVLEYDAPVEQGNRRLLALNWPRMIPDDCQSYFDAEAAKHGLSPVGRKYRESSLFYKYAWQKNHLSGADMRREVERHGYVIH